MECRYALGIGLAAVAAVVIGLSTRLVVVRTGQQAEAQELLNAAKDRQLQADLKEKDRQIAETQRGATEASAKAEGFRLEIAKANDSAAKSQERAVELESRLLKLRKETEPRRLSGSQKERLARFLAVHPTPIGIVSRLVDTEASDFADDFEEALKNAHWETLRIKNRISSKYGVSISFVSATAPNRAPELRMLDEALTAIGVPHQIVEYAVGEASISPAFQERGLYLVVDEKPPVEKTE